LKETRPLWPPQRGVGLREPNLGKTNPRVTLFIRLRFVLRPLSRTHFLTLIWLVVVINFVNFSFALFTPPPLGDYQVASAEGEDEPDYSVKKDAIEGIRLQAVEYINKYQAKTIKWRDRKVKLKNIEPGHLVLRRVANPDTVGKL
jgi:hypothetical protein